MADCFIRVCKKNNASIQADIGIAQGGAAEAPPTPILEGAKPLHF